jgi:tRNA(Ile)-lysidine synthase
MALLRAMLEIKAAEDGAGRIFAGHVNHQLRGDASVDDEAWLRGQCERLGAPLLVERCDVGQLAAVQGDGVEAAAREARYRLLTRMAEASGARYLALAHTRDDQVETILHRILRGTGLRGLAGMPSMRAVSPGVTLARPLLGCTRGEVLEYLRGLDQPYREDATNQELHFTRNRLRRELLPVLRQDYNSDVDDALLRLAELAGEAQAVVEGLAADVLQACAARVHDRQVELGTAPLGGKPPLVVCEVFRLLWRTAGFSEQGMTRQWWQKLAQFAQSADASGALNLPGNVIARRHAGGKLSLTAPRLS